MIWNWQKKDWPHFSFKDSSLLKELERKFLHNSGIILGSYKHVSDDDRDILKVELLSQEALKTSEIEGEYLSRDSLQSSIRRHFGLATDNRKISPSENGITEMMVDLYQSFRVPLTHEVLFNWHSMLINSRRDLSDVGCYRTHQESMRVISGNVYEPKIHFEAPPSEQVPHEMEEFIDWFNRTAPLGKNSLPALIRAGIAHLYFVCIHPFEDGNGRIGRALSEKSLSQCLGEPTLIALSHVIQKKKKDYYEMLESSNKSNEITEWLIYFSKTILEAQEYTQAQIDFLIKKTKLYDKIKGQLNARQEKVIARMFREGPEGFKGGLSAENYFSMVKASKATVTRDLHDLVLKGVLVQQGERKSTRYFLKI